MCRGFIQSYFLLRPEATPPTQPETGAENATSPSLYRRLEISPCSEGLGIVNKRVILLREEKKTPQLDLLRTQKRISHQRCGTGTVGTVTF
jgi:hypothetical protein